MPTIHAIPPLVPPPQTPRCGREHSNHAIHLHFTEKIALFVRHQISASPFKEWHSFTCIPAREGSGGSLLTSNAGDWTRDATETLQPYHRVKRIPVTGVLPWLPMALLFKKFIVVATCSRTGPCLVVIQNVPVVGTKICVIWSTPSSLETYGWEICEAVKKVDK